MPDVSGLDAVGQRGLRGPVAQGAEPQRRDEDAALGGAQHVVDQLPKLGVPHGVSLPPRADSPETTAVGRAGAGPYCVGVEQDELDRRIRRYYGAHFDEDARLVSRSVAGQVELARMRQLVGSRLVSPSAVLDVGGATGVHARWLAAEGHRVTLVDPVPEQVAVAARVGTFEAVVGDARALDVPDDAFDAVLLLGPLYHLRTRGDRLAALREAARVLRREGLLFAAGISRLSAATVVTLGARFADLPGEALLRMLETGENSPEIESPEGGFPGGHYHTAAELADELTTAGFAEVEVVGVEGPGTVGFEFLAPDDALAAGAVAIAERAQDIDWMADLSGHLLGIARKP